VNDVGVNVSTEEGHGAASAKGLSGNIFCCEADRWAYNGHGHTKSCCDVFGKNVVAVVGVIVGGEWQGCR